MQIKLETAPAAQVECEALIVAGFDKEDPGAPLSTDALKVVNGLTNGWIEELYTSGEFSGKPFDAAVLYRPENVKAKRVMVIGGGKLEKADIRRIAGGAVRKLRERGVRTAALALDPGAGEAEIAAAVEGAVLGGYAPDQHKTEKKDAKEVEVFSVIVPGANAGALEPAVERARIIAEAQNFARAVASEPANNMTPLKLADAARAMAAEQGLECEVLDQDRMRQLGMGALLGVAQGSEEPPCLIILRYRPASEAAGPHLGLVGKGVTFDTGGISIKPSADMDKMKYDMAGGAAAIGAMRAITQLKPAIPVTALVPAVENMPGGRAQRPGDIVKTLSGKTVEVLNTDAEGRLILADTMTYAQKLGCTHLVDAATLTGAIVVALGHVNTGAFANNEALLERVLAAARAEGEKTWPMPLDDEYKAELESAFADLPNIGSRWGGAVTAAMFLKTFADPLPWVHLDVAGTAWLDEEKPFLAAGPTGAPLRTFVRVAVDWK